jgi:hypothetical protein
MTLDASGNLAVGVTTPVYKLQSGGTAGINSELTVAYGGGNNGITFTQDWRIRRENATTGNLWVENSGNAIAVFTSAGNVGIGTSSAILNGVTTIAQRSASGAGSTNLTLDQYNANNKFIQFGWYGTNIGSISQASGTFINIDSPIIGLSTGGTERMRITAAGVVELTSGQLKFPATQSASSDANTLDDYEEGTWTPNQGSGLTVVGAFSSVGRYTKIGNQVTLIGSVTGATSISCSAGGILTSNAPFSQVNVFGIGAAVNGTITSGSNLLISGTTIYSTTAMSGSTVIYFTITYFTT